MLGLDDFLAGWSNGGSLLVVLLVAALLGVRHAADPDHLAAVTSLAAAGRAEAAARLGLLWGLGHALTLVVLGAPVLVLDAALPDAVLRGAETTIAALIVVLALRVLLRRPGRDGEPGRGARTPLAAFGIGLVHGVGGSAGVGVLLVAAIPSPPLAVAALALLAACTAAAMTVVTSGFGLVLASRAASATAAAPALGAASLLFGLWYAAAVWSLAPYPF